MPSFTDNQNRKWHVTLSVATVKALRDRINLDLLSTDETQKPAFERLAGDPVLMVDALWVLVEPQAQTQGVTDVEFGSSLGGDSIEDATNAFLEALAEFFPRQRRAVMLKALGKLRELEKASLTLTAATIDATNVTKAMNEALEAINQETTKANSTDGKPSTNLPGSSASTPTP
jgi:hypothetical protein